MSLTPHDAVPLMSLVTHNRYRDLSKPMGAQDPARLEKFIKRFNDLIELGEVPYHYGSHYSSVGSVLHLLVRLEPFTQLFLELQGGRLDFADRTFHDIGGTWDLYVFPTLLAITRSSLRLDSRTGCAI